MVYVTCLPIIFVDAFHYMLDILCVCVCACMCCVFIHICRSVQYISAAGIMGDFVLFCVCFIFSTLSFLGSDEVIIHESLYDNSKNDSEK